jgi:Tol biopolymer transport system component
MRTDLAILALVAASAPLASAQVTTRQSVGPGGVQSDGWAVQPDVSRDGRYVAFECGATNLVPGDTNGVWDTFVRDRWTGTTERVSVASDGTQGDVGSFEPSISGDGRFVVFPSFATNLVAGDSGGHMDIFVRDRWTSTTERLSVSSGGVQGNGRSDTPRISAEGRFVVFSSDATNLVAGDTDQVRGVFVRDRASGTTDLASLPPVGGWPGFGATDCDDGAISSDGRFVAFCRYSEVYVRDRSAGVTTQVTHGLGGAPLNSACERTRISGDGSRLAFLCWATNLLATDTSNLPDVIVADWPAGTIRCASVSPSGTSGNGYSWQLDLSEDGRFVAFSSEASDLVTGDTNFRQDVFLRDLAVDTTERVSLATDGTQANDYSYDPAVSRDGRFVVFDGSATNLVPGDSNLQIDVFLHDRAATGFTSLCDPGVGGTLACPCSNPPAGSGRGCDNSQATGGASLSASGAAYLSDDGLVFTTIGERSSALSILLQGNTGAPGGLAYGQGVRCAAGTLKRLFTKTAAGGSITAPDFGAGDPSVSARSAAMGDPIPVAGSRWYLVYYRDPIVLGACPSSLTFNATQTGQIAWSP